MAIMMVLIFSIYEAFQESKWSTLRKFMKENERDIFQAVSGQAELIRNSMVRTSIDGSLHKTGRNIDLVLKELDSKMARVSQLENELISKQQIINGQEIQIRDLKKSLQEKSDELKQSQMEKQETLKHFEETFLERHSRDNVSTTSLRDLRHLSQANLVPVPNIVNLQARLEQLLEENSQLQKQSQSQRQQISDFASIAQ